MRKPSYLPRRLPFRRLIADERGVTAITVGLSLTTLMGFAGMAVDVGLWYSDKRSAQEAVDAAAYSAAIDYAAGDTASGAAATAKAITAQYGLTNGSNGVTVTVNQPPLSGSHTSSSGAVEVIVNKSETMAFSKVLESTQTVSSRAVAMAGSGSGSIGPYCVLALDTSPSTSVSTADISLSNGATLDMSQCGLQVNSSGADSLSVTGGANLTATTLSLVGNYTTSNGGSVHVSGTIATNASPGADPYAKRTVPTPGTCASTNSYGWGNYTLSPGTFCNGLTFSNGANVTLNPGVYIIDRGTLNIGYSTIIGTGVTFVLTSSTGSNYPTFTIGNGASLNITAPTTGATAGMAFFQDPKAPNSGTNSFGGGSTQIITGAIYFPSQIVAFSNGTSNTSTCTQLIAFRIQYTGGAKFGNNCSGTGVLGIGAAPATTTALVE